MSLARLLPLALLLACGDDKGGVHTGEPTETGETWEDQDRDGYTADEDCDDSDATVNPGAEEICDGADDN